MTEAKGSSHAEEGEQLRPYEDQICQRLIELTEQGLIQWSFLKHDSQSQPAIGGEFNYLGLELPRPTSTGFQKSKLSLTIRIPNHQRRIISREVDIRRETDLQDPLFRLYNLSKQSAAKLPLKTQKRPPLILDGRTAARILELLKTENSLSFTL